MASSRDSYRALSADRKARLFERIAEYHENNKEQRRAWVNAWRRRTGRALPADLVEFRRAIAFLEEAVESARHAQGVRQPGQERCNDAAER